MAEMVYTRMNKFKISNSLRKELLSKLGIEQYYNGYESNIVFYIVINIKYYEELKEWKKEQNYKINIGRFIGISVKEIEKFDDKLTYFEHLIKVYFRCDKVYPETMKWIGWFKI